jgi:hypothetical protein
MGYLLDNNRRIVKPVPADNNNTKKSHSTNWFCRLLQNNTDVSVMVFELVIETNGNTSKYGEFLKQLDDMIHDDADNFGGILSTSDLWEGIVLVSIILEPGRLGELMIRLAVMPGVERVEEGLVSDGESKDTMGVDTPFPVNSRAKNRIRVVMEKPVTGGY